jgi:hypothetical protein
MDSSDDEDIKLAIALSLLDQGGTPSSNNNNNNNDDNSNNNQHNQPSAQPSKPTSSNITNRSTSHYDLLVKLEQERMRKNAQQLSTRNIAVKPPQTLSQIAPNTAQQAKPSAAPMSERQRLQQERFLQRSATSGNLNNPNSQLNSTLNSTPTQTTDLFSTDMVRSASTTTSSLENDHENKSVMTNATFPDKNDQNNPHTPFPISPLHCVHPLSTPAFYLQRLGDAITPEGSINRQLYSHFDVKNPSQLLTTDNTFMTVKYSGLIPPGITRAVFLTANLDPDWFCEEFSALKNGLCEQISIVLPHFDTQKYSQLRDFFSPIVIHMHEPHMLTQWGVHHPKVIMLFHNNGMRFVCGTGNLEHIEANFLHQGLYYQDFPHKDLIPSIFEPPTIDEEVRTGLIPNLNDDVVNYRGVVDGGSEDDKINAAKKMAFFYSKHFPPTTKTSTISSLSTTEQSIARITTKLADNIASSIQLSSLLLRSLYYIENAFKIGSSSPSEGLKTDNIVNDYTKLLYTLLSYLNQHSIYQTQAAYYLNINNFESHLHSFLSNIESLCPRPTRTETHHGSTPKQSHNKVCLGSQLLKNYDFSTAIPALVMTIPGPTCSFDHAQLRIRHLLYALSDGDAQCDPMDVVSWGKPIGDLEKEQEFRGNLFLVWERSKEAGKHGGNNERNTHESHNAHLAYLQLRLHAGRFVQGSGRARTILHTTDDVIAKMIYLVYINATKTAQDGFKNLPHPTTFSQFHTLLHHLYQYSPVLRPYPNNSIMSVSSLGNLKTVMLKSLIHSFHSPIPLNILKKMSFLPQNTRYLHNINTSLSDLLSYIPDEFGSYGLKALETSKGNNLIKMFKKIEHGDKTKIDDAKWSNNQPKISPSSDPFSTSHSLEPNFRLPTYLLWPTADQIKSTPLGLYAGGWLLFQESNLLSIFWTIFAHYAPVTSRKTITPHQKSFTQEFDFFPFSFLSNNTNEYILPGYEPYGMKLTDRSGWDVGLNDLTDNDPNKPNNGKNVGFYGQYAPSFQQSINLALSSHLKHSQKFDQLNKLSSSAQIGQRNQLVPNLTQNSNFSAANPPFFDLHSNAQTFAFLSLAISTLFSASPSQFQHLLHQHQIIYVGNNNPSGNDKNNDSVRAIQGNQNHIHSLENVSKIVHSMTPPLSTGYILNQTLPWVVQCSQNLSQSAIGVVKTIPKETIQILAKKIDSNAQTKKTALPGVESTKAYQYLVKRRTGLITGFDINRFPVCLDETNIPGRGSDDLIGIEKINKKTNPFLEVINQLTEYSAQVSYELSEERNLDRDNFAQTHRTTPHPNSLTSKPTHHGTYNQTFLDHHCQHFPYLYSLLTLFGEHRIVNSRLDRELQLTNLSKFLTTSTTPPSSVISSLPLSHLLYAAFRCNEPLQQSTFFSTIGIGHSILTHQIPREYLPIIHPTLSTSQIHHMSTVAQNDLSMKLRYGEIISDLVSQPHFLQTQQHFELGTLFHPKLHRIMYYLSSLSTGLVNITQVEFSLNESPPRDGAKGIKRGKTQQTQLDGSNNDNQVGLLNGLNLVKNFQLVPKSDQKSGFWCSNPDQSKNSAEKIFLPKGEWWEKNIKMVITDLIMKNGFHTVKKDILSAVSILFPQITINIDTQSLIPVVFSPNGPVEKLFEIATSVLSLFIVINNFPPSFFPHLLNPSPLQTHTNPTTPTLTSQKLSRFMTPLFGLNVGSDVQFCGDFVINLLRLHQQEKLQHFILPMSKISLTQLSAQTMANSLNNPGSEYPIPIHGVGSSLGIGGNVLGGTNGSSNSHKDLLITSLGNPTSLTQFTTTICQYLSIDEIPPISINEQRNEPFCQFFDTLNRLHLSVICPLPYTVHPQYYLPSDPTGSDNSLFNTFLQAAASMSPNKTDPKVPSKTDQNMTFSPDFHIGMSLSNSVIPSSLTPWFNGPRG